MKKYKVTTELYHEFMKFKNDLLQFITTEIFYYYKDYIDNGDLIFTGSIIYDRLGYIKKDYFGDIDISINDNLKGDEFTKTFLLFLNQIELKEYKNEYINKYQDKILENNEHLSFDSIMIIDVFRNKHPENSSEYENIEIYPNIYTKYFGHEWNIEKIYHTYLEIIKLDDPEKKSQQILKFSKIFETYLKFIDINEFNDKNLLKKMNYVINLTKNPFIL